MELGDQNLKRMAMLFADIRASTALLKGMTAKLTARQNIDFLNAYLWREPL